jgi:hypothetical protein
MVRYRPASGQPLRHRGACVLQKLLGVNVVVPPALGERFQQPAKCPPTARQRIVLTGQVNRAVQMASESRQSISMNERGRPLLGSTSGDCSLCANRRRDAR